MPAARGVHRTPAGQPAQGSRGAIDDEQGEVIDLDAQDADPDPAVRARAQEIAARLAVPRPRADAGRRRGTGGLRSLRYQGGSDDVDLDWTLQVLTERPVPDDEDIVVRERLHTSRDVVLLVDISGSMRGERIRTAAAMVGALAGELTGDQLAVVAFWSDAAVLLRLGDAVRPGRLLEQLLRLPAQGLTNLAFPLQLARQELSRSAGRNPRVLLLSDCVHNAGPDPRPLAARLPRLDVLLDATDERDEELGRDLSRLGRGRFRRISTYREVAPALSAVFRR